MKAVPFWSAIAICLLTWLLMSLSIDRPHHEGSHATEHHEGGDHGDHGDEGGHEEHSEDNGGH